MTAKYIGKIYDKLALVRCVPCATTNRYNCWEAAQIAAEKLCATKYGPNNQRYFIDVSVVG